MDSLVPTLLVANVPIFFRLQEIIMFKRNSQPLKTNMVIIIWISRIWSVSFFFIFLYITSKKRNNGRKSYLFYFLLLRDPFRQKQNFSTRMHSKGSLQKNAHFVCKYWFYKWIKNCYIFPITRFWMKRLTAIEKDVSKR